MNYLEMLKHIGNNRASRVSWVDVSKFIMWCDLKDTPRKPSAYYTDSQYLFVQSSNDPELRLFPLSKSDFDAVDWVIFDDAALHSAIPVPIIH